MILNYLNDILSLNIPDMNIGITSGCFDMIHVKHVQYLRRCKSKCSKLFVFVDSDELTLTNKKKLPIINEFDRVQMIDALGGIVDFAIILNKYEEIRSFCSYFKSSVVFKNSNNIYGSKLIDFGAPNHIIPDINHLQSTTEIKNYIKNEGSN